MSSKRLVLSSASLIAGTMLIYTGLSSNASYAEKEKAEKPRIDLAFCVDTTGSMSNEIEAVKSKTKEIVAKLGGSKPTPDIRVGLVAFRDRGDEYVTKVFQFSNDIDKVVKDISSLRADGGGDEPEAVNEALHAAVNDLQWSSDKKSVKILFVIGDAGPHKYPGDYSWDTESKNAIARGIQINTIACDGLNNSRPGLDVFQKIAKLADGKCEFLTYRQEIVEAGGHKSTVVSSAGRMFKVEGKSVDDWREGADKLMARGAAAPCAPSYRSAARFSGVAAESMAAGAAGAPLASPMAMMRGKIMAPSTYAGAGGSAAGDFASGTISRADSNLADIVLSATKEAAKKKANIEYKD